MTLSPILVGHFQNAGVHLMRLSPDTAEAPWDVSDIRAKATICSIVTKGAFDLTDDQLRCLVAAGIPWVSFFGLDAEELHDRYDRLKLEGVRWMYEADENVVKTVFTQTYTVDEVLFETFVLASAGDGYAGLDPAYLVITNDDIVVHYLLRYLDWGSANGWRHTDRSFWVERQA